MEGVSFCEYWCVRGGCVAALEVHEAAKLKVEADSVPQGDGLEAGLAVRFEPGSFKI